MQLREARGVANEQARELEKARGEVTRLRAMESQSEVKESQSKGTIRELGDKCRMLKGLVGQLERTRDGLLQKLESKGGEKLGELLESAAVCGADLSKLVAKIPKGIAISGLKEKLLAAIKDYKNVLAIHSNSEKVGENDHLQLLRCKSQIIRRGVNSQLLKTGGGGGGASGGAGAGAGRYNIKTRSLFVAQSTAERNKRASNVSDIKPARMLALRMYKKRQQQAVVLR